MSQNMFVESKRFCLRIFSLEKACRSGTWAKELIRIFSLGARRCDERRRPGSSEHPECNRDRGQGQESGRPRGTAETAHHRAELLLVDRLAPFLLPHQPMTNAEAEVRAGHDDQEGEGELAHQ